MSTIESNDNNYEKLIKENKLILFDFFGTWCSPCKALSPILDAVAIDMKDNLVIAKHDIDSSPNFPTMQNVRGVPALYLYKDQKLVSQKIGMTSKEDLVTWLKEFI